MTILLVALAAAFCVWLTVRIINRRERWAKWTLAGVVGVPVLYVASFGPASWLMSRTSLCTEAITTVYQPVFFCWMRGPEKTAAWINWYCYVGAKKEWYWGSPGYMPPAINGYYPRQWPYHDRM
jgi:hypothetical protein